MNLNLNSKTPHEIEYKMVGFAVGDVRYGKGPHNRFFREQLGIERLLLRASHLGFTHPYTGETLSIRAAPEPAWEDLMERLGWRIAAQA